ncbi:capsular polysaccharide transport system permease protein [Cognatiyoonia sediminum]|uniref:Capsular polysaccharide transport system permease protein n=1 Tax=Cognatiyoonia sediminum TaxID=1508389 RepID=A0A1M5NXF0_9RHOB|nr:capsule biosynthesis protein [Cognatiyoonia sediminum]SHG94201.1 capsular polysaccharide transport system permease protein [Cognatiyoonia sediminum]
MTTKPKAKKFRIRRTKTGAAQKPVEQEAASVTEQAQPAEKTTVDIQKEIDAIRREGITGRQLRVARRLAQKKGMAVTSDFDAVRQLREAGLDPFEREALLELVQPDGTTASQKAPSQQLPQTVPAAGQNLPSTQTLSPSERRNVEITTIQKQIAARRRKKLALLFTRLACFVLLPTALVGWYFFTVATPMYSTKSEFVIQTADSGAGAGGLGGLFQGTSIANQQDSITVQSYLTSRAAMLRLDEEHGFKQHFSQDRIDAIQRLPADASNEQAFSVYADKVKIGYDPTEGILKMEVIAADPETSQLFSEALIGYAEEQVDQLTQRLREDQMSGASASYEAAEARRAEALSEWLAIQQEFEIIDPGAETAALLGQISTLEADRQRLQLTLQERLNVARPNEAQVSAIRGQIANIEGLIADIRAQMTNANNSESSLASRNTELRLAEENYTFQTMLVQQALTQMETAQIEANRQVRYLSLGVEPVAPDEATYPKAFQNTLLAFLIFSGVYLMISLTASILREQVSS